MEKLRHTQLTEGEVYQGDLPLEIHLSANEEAGLSRSQTMGSA